MKRDGYTHGWMHGQMDGRTLLVVLDVISQFLFILFLYAASRHVEEREHRMYEDIMELKEQWKEWEDIPTAGSRDKTEGDLGK